MVSDIGKGTERSETAVLSTEPREEQGDATDALTLDPRLDRLIGRSLQAHYADIVSSPLPDTILVLLAQLEAKEKSA